MEREITDFDSICISRQQAFWMVYCQKSTCLWPMTDNNGYKKKQKDLSRFQGKNNWIIGIENITQLVQSFENALQCYKLQCSPPMFQRTTQRL